MADDVNLPIIPDKVMDDVRKGKPVPLERISEAAAEMRSSSAAVRKAPVHAGQLRAITKETAKSMVEGTAIPGQTLPMLPRTRAVIPEPFQRRRINADRHGKTWQTDKASSIVAGDMVKGIGLVAETWKQIRYSTRGEVLGAVVCVPSAPSCSAHPLGHGLVPYDGPSVVLDSAGSPVERPDEPVAVGTDCYFRNVAEATYKCNQEDIVEVFRKAPED
jgi:hypothetical protein